VSTRFDPEGDDGTAGFAAAERLLNEESDLGSLLDSLAGLEVGDEGRRRRRNGHQPKIVPRDALRAEPSTPYRIERRPQKPSEPLASFRHGVERLNALIHGGWNDDARRVLLWPDLETLRVPVRYWLRSTEGERKEWAQAHGACSAQRMDQTIFLAAVLLLTLGVEEGDLTFRVQRGDPISRTSWVAPRRDGLRALMPDGGWLVPLTDATVKVISGLLLTDPGALWRLHWCALVRCTTGRRYHGHQHWKEKRCGPLTVKDSYVPKIACCHLHADALADARIKDGINRKPEVPPISNAPLSDAELVEMLEQTVVTAAPPLFDSDATPDNLPHTSQT
jgi:hypothetical protein